MDTAATLPLHSVVHPDSFERFLISDAGICSSLQYFVAATPSTQPTATTPEVSARPTTEQGSPLGCNWPTQCAVKGVCTFARSITPSVATDDHRCRRMLRKRILRAEQRVRLGRGEKMSSEEARTREQRLQGLPAICPQPEWGTPQRTQVVGASASSGCRATSIHARLALARRDARFRAAVPYSQGIRSRCRRLDCWQRERRCCA